ncbi:hypothetical protein LTR36_005920 [Oleoguttula mirabilis]|uniref:Peptidase M12A domain-containing protein n=1 Tax=Oleoguttula mirabilis TaxID=1507867 RepID=A0AAV9JEE9_9PEZI|nr:hypothetical protein LTR36_005920 [Oleoguttula mirabilis]
MKQATNTTQLFVVLLALLVLCMACPEPEIQTGKVTTGATDLSGSELDHLPLVQITPDDGGIRLLAKRIKRWYSVLTFAEISAGRSSVGTDVDKYKHAPWPVKCGHQWVRYCFKDEHSADLLLETLAHAIVLWHPASQYSGLAVQPDTACFDPSDSTSNYRCICGRQENGQETDVDALVIGDGRESSDKTKWPAYSVTILGYNYVEPERAGRHWMIFGGFNTANTAGMTPAQLKSDHIRTMAHELGHAMGLDHEHQRPDVNTFVAFDCEWNVGYPEAAARAMASNQYFQAIETVEERMATVCSRSDYATKFWPRYLPWIIGSEFKSKATQDYAGDNEPFDYGSIMIYSSTLGFRLAGSQRDARVNFKIPMLRKRKDKTRSFPDSLFFQGGNREPGLARISAWDIRRVAALYPGTATQQRDAAGLGVNGVNWNPVAYSIAGLVPSWTLQPAPLDVAYADLDGNLLGDAPAAAADAGDVDLAAAALDDLALEGETGTGD